MIVVRAFDAVVIASRLPDASGWQACWAMREALRSRCPSLVLLDKKHGRSSAAEPGADAFVAAPFAAEGVRAQLTMLFHQCKLALKT